MQNEFAVKAATPIGGAFPRKPVLINGPTFDPATGRATSQDAAQALAAAGLPLQLYQLALNELLTGKHVSLERALQAVCANHGVVLTGMVQAIAAYIDEERSMLAEREAAEATLQAVNARIRGRQDEALSVVTTRDSLELAIKELEAEIRVIMLRREQVEPRRKVWAARLKSATRAGSSMPHTHLAELGLKIASYDVVLAQFSANLADKRLALQTAEAEYKAFMAANADALALVPLAGV